MDKIQIVYIPFPDRESAQLLSRELIAGGWIACANMFPIQSLYYWDKKLQEDGEFVVLCKTLSEKVEGLMKMVERLHPYEVPCIWTSAVSCNRQYAEWIRKELEDQKKV